MKHCTSKCNFKFIEAKNQTFHQNLKTFGQIGDLQSLFHPLSYTTPPPRIVAISLTHALIQKLFIICFTLESVGEYMLMFKKAFCLV
jgi:hypothetical protein